MYRDDTKPIEQDNFLYEPFRHAVILGEKDLGLALALAEERSIELPLAEVALENLAAGLGMSRTKEK